MDHIRKVCSLSNISLNLIVDLIDIFCPQKESGCPRKLSTLDCFLHTWYVLHTGVPWRWLQPCMRKGTWSTVYVRFQKWVKEDIFTKIYSNILEFYKNRRQKPIKNLFIDTTFVKNVLGRNCLGRSPVDRGRKACKLSVIVDDKGVAHSLTFHPGNHNDCKTMHSTLLLCPTAFLTGKSFCGDKGYDTSKCHEEVQRLGMVDNIWKRKCSQSPSRPSRAVVENFFAWLDCHRRLILRYDQDIKVYSSFTILGCLAILCKNTCHKNTI